MCGDGMEVKRIYMVSAGVVIALMLSLITLPSVWLAANYQVTVEQQQLGAGDEKGASTYNATASTYDTKVSRQLAYIGLNPLTGIALSTVVIAVVFIAYRRLRRVDERG